MNTHTRKLLLTAGVSAAALCGGTLAVPAWSQTSGAPAAQATDNSAVIITTRRKALLSADERKRNSDTIIDSVVADEAGKLPDNSITEVLQRVSGVSIVRFNSLGDPDHFSAEGSGIQIRGLSGVSGKLNGREVFSANGGRGLSWGDVTPELMAAVDVYKSGTADIIEGGTGGAIDLRTKMPFDYKKPAFQASLGESYGDLSKDTTPSASFLVTKRWDTPIGEIGALVDLAYSKYDQNTNFIRMEPFYKTQVKGLGDRYIPGGIDYGYDHFERDRTGIYGAFQWKPNDSLNLYTTLFSTKYVQDGYGQGVFATSNHLTVDPKGSATFDDNGGFIKGDLATYRTSDGAVYDNNGALVGGTIGAGGDTGVSHSENVTSDWSTGFRWVPSDSFRLEGAVQFVDSEHKSVAYDVFPSMAFPGQVNIDLTGDYPLVTFPDSTQFSNLGNYHWNATQDHTESNHGSLGAANLDAEWKLSDTGLFRSLKIGARYAERTEHDGVGGYNWTALGQGWNGSPNAYFNSAATRAGDVTQVPFDNFFRGDTSPPHGVYLPSIAMVEKYDPVGDHAVYGGNPQNPIGLKSYEFSSASTATTAFYAMTKFAGDHSLFNGTAFSGNFGVRVVTVDNKASGYYTQPSSKFLRDGQYYDIEAITNGTLNTGGRKSTRVMPDFNIQFSPSNQFKLRFAYGVTMDNPSFSSLRANGGLGVTTIANPLTHAAIPASGSTPAQPAANYPAVWTGFTTSSGNPTLKPTMSNNFDLSAELYESKSFTAHFAVFYKSISNPLVYKNTTVDVPVTYTAATTAPGAGGVPAYSTAYAGTRIETALKTDLANSSEKATVKGFELGARKFFDSLPSPWDGLGVEANYTYIDSANPGDLGYGIDNVVSTSATVNGSLTPVRDANNQVVNSHPLTDNPLTGLSKHNVNMTLMYEHSAWSLRLAYSWRSPYLMNTGVHGTNPAYTYYDYTNNKAYGIQTGLPLWSDEYGTLDFGGSYKINDHFKLSVNASNLTNAVVKTQMYGGYPGNANFTRSWFVTDQRINVGLSISY